MRSPVSLRIDEPLFRRLDAHLFPGDGDEHGAVIAAGIAEAERGTRLLAREVFLAADGIDYVPGTRGYRALTPRFVAEKSGYCASQKLCYLAVHCHRGSDSVAFSRDDLNSHDAAIRRCWTSRMAGRSAPWSSPEMPSRATSGRGTGAHARPHDGDRPPHQNVYPEPRCRPPGADPIYDRHARLFGDLGQDILSRLKVGIIGLGGGGSLVNEWLARLGVGHIVGIDFDRIEPSNLPRVVGATRWDAATWLTLSNSEWMRQRLGMTAGPAQGECRSPGRRKANPRIRYDAIVGNVLDEPTARLIDRRRLPLPRQRHDPEPPGLQCPCPPVPDPRRQIGAKVAVDKRTRQVGYIFVATRPVLPSAGHGCLLCHQLVPPARLNEEVSDRRRAPGPAVCR